MYTLNKVLGVSLALGDAMFSAAPVPIYKKDPSWQPAWPEFFGWRLYSAMAVVGDEIFVSQRGNYSQPILVLDRAGHLLHSFGNHSINDEHLKYNHFGHTWGGHGLVVQHADAEAGRPEDRIWVMDCLGDGVPPFISQIDVFAPNGTHIKSVGHAGYDKEGFGCLSDAVFHGDKVYIADGDGTDDNRIEAWAAASGVPEKNLWVSDHLKYTKGGLYHLWWPHSIAWIDGLDKLIIADRDNSRLVLMDPETGHIDDTLACKGLDISPYLMPAPFAVRTLRTKDEHLLFVAVSNEAPQDGDPKNQWLYIVDVSKLATGGQCEVVQRINYAKEECETPHLLEVDPKTQDVYMSCVGAWDLDMGPTNAGSNVVRVIRRSDVSIVV